MRAKLLAVAVALLSVVGCTAGPDQPSPTGGAASSAPESASTAAPAGTVVRGYGWGWGEDPPARLGISDADPPTYDLYLSGRWDAVTGHLFVTLWGSSCPTTRIVSAVATDARSLTLTTEYDVITSSQHAAGGSREVSCPADLHPWTWEIVAPDVIDPGQPLSLDTGDFRALVEPLVAAPSSADEVGPTGRIVHTR